MQLQCVTELWTIYTYVGTSGCDRMSSAMWEIFHDVASSNVKRIRGYVAPGGGSRSQSI